MHLMMFSLFILVSLFCVSAENISDCIQHREAIPE